MADQTSILFVCLGNICRSPLAEGVFVDLARKRGVSDRFRVDSCGTGDWHAGQIADPRSRAVARKHQIELVHRARVLVPETDLEPPPPKGRGFHWLIGMDRQNCRRMIALGAEPERVALLRSFDRSLSGKPEQELEVPDPYTEPDEAFEAVFGLVERACEGLLDFLLKPG